MSEDNLQKFSRLVLENLEIQSLLKPIADREEFICKVLELGKNAGYEFSREDIEHQIRETRRLWFARCI